MLKGGRGAALRGPWRGLRLRPGTPVAAALLAFGCMLGATPVAAAEPADLEPARLALRDLDGAPRSLEDLRGRIVVLNFWATWCIPCREEMPVFMEIRRRYAGRGVEVVAASADVEGDLHKVRAFIDELGMELPVWIGATVPDMIRLDLGDALPATAIIDREGAVAFRIRGPVTGEDLVSRLEYLLEGGEGSAPDRLLDTFARSTDRLRTPADALREGGGAETVQVPAERAGAEAAGTGGSAEGHGPSGPGSTDEAVPSGSAAGAAEAPQADDPGHGAGDEDAHVHEEGEGHHHGPASGEDASLVPS